MEHFPFSVSLQPTHILAVRVLNTRRVAQIDEAKNVSIGAFSHVCFCVAQSLYFITNLIAFNRICTREYMIS